MIASRKEAKHNEWYGIEEDLIRGLYLGLLGREPDVPGMLHWISRIQAGDSVEEIAQEILHSNECLQRKNKGMFKDSFHSLCVRVAEWAQHEMAASPLYIADVSAQKLTYENHFYEKLNNFKIPYHMHAYGPLDYFCQEDDNLHCKVTLSPDFICDGKIHDFHLNEPDYASSFLPFHPWMMNRLADTKQFTTMRVDAVPTLTLDHALHDREHIDLLKINIHGMELLSLQHAIDTLKRTEVVHCNVSFIEMYEGQSRFNDVEQFMRAQGFDLIDFYDQRHYAFASTSFSWSRDILGQVGAVFFRRLDADAPVRSIVSQSLLALMVYQKPSLAAWLVKPLESAGHSLAKLFSK